MEYLSHRCVRNASPKNTPPLLGTIQLVAQKAAIGNPLLRQLAEVVVETDLRFKVIMSARDWPTPLPANQYLRLGSLAEPADAGAAETLLRRPLESLGVVFEDEDSFSLLLLAAGYLPQQLQQLGQRLLAHLYAQPQPAPGERPVYYLTSNDVETVLRDATAGIDQLIGEVVERTAHHYLVFLLLSCPAAQEQFAGAPGIGLLVTELWQAARHYWPAGFEGPDAGLVGHYQIIANEFTEASLTLCTADDRYFLAENCWFKMGSTQEMAAELAGFAARAQAALPGTTQAAGPASPPAATKSSMLKRLTNGRRRL